MSLSVSLFWTDWMIWLLVVSLFIWAKKALKSPQTQQQWQKVFQSKVAMIAAVILLSYLFIALLDSIHITLRIGENLPGLASNPTLLDHLFAHLAHQQERTYSAPFALFEYAKSMQVLENGEVVHSYLPLKYVSQEFSVLSLLLFSLMISTVMFAALSSLHIKYLASKQQKSFKQQLGLIVSQQTLLPWRTAYATFAGVLIFLVTVYIFSFSYHVLGTDKVGSDVLYESLKSIRTGVLIGVLTTLVMLPLALFLGISAGLFKGWVDDVIQYLYTTLNSIPGVLLIAAAVLVMQVIMSNNPDWFSSTEDRADLRLLFLVFILGMTSWTGLCRLLRAETLKISQIEFVVAARAFGVSRFKIIRQHILPNVMHIVLIAVVLDFSGLVLAEAVLSYVGVGVDPTMHSWGNMINQARLEMAREPMVWWSLFSAFFFMFILVLSANLFSDRVQQVLDPRGHS